MCARYARGGEETEEDQRTFGLREDEEEEEGETGDNEGVGTRARFVNIILEEYSN